MAKATIRTKDASKAWVSKGQTKDSGAGSKARAALSDLAPDDATVKKMKAACGKVATALKGLSEDQQRAVCFSAASDYTFDSLVQKSKEGRQTRNLKERRLERMNELTEGKTLTASEFMAMLDKVKSDIRYPTRKAG